MKTPTAPATGKAMYQAMIAKAESDLDQLFLQEKESQRKSAKAEQELHALSARSAARSETLQAVHTDVESLQTLVEQKRASVGIAEGTGAHSDLVEALRGLERQLQKATQKLQDVQASTIKEEQGDIERSAVADSICRRENIALQRIAEKRSSIGDARDRAHHDLGQEERTETLALVEVLQQHVATKQQQLDQAELELEERLYQSIDRLAEWPEHRNSIRALLPVHDFKYGCIGSGSQFRDCVPGPARQRRSGHRFHHIQASWTIAICGRIQPANVSRK